MTTSKRNEVMFLEHSTVQQEPWFFLLVGAMLGVFGLVMMQVFEVAVTTEWFKTWSKPLLFVVAVSVMWYTPVALALFFKGRKPLNTQELVFLASYLWGPAAQTRIQACICHSKQTMKACELWSICRIEAKSVVDEKKALEQKKHAMLTSMVHKHFCQKQACVTQP